MLDGRVGGDAILLKHPRSPYKMFAVYVMCVCVCVYIKAGFTPSH